MLKMDGKGKNPERLNLIPNKGEFAVTQERRSVIVTFKPKEKRPDKSTDKVDIVRGVLPQGMQNSLL